MVTMEVKSSTTTLRKTCADVDLDEFGMCGNRTEFRSWPPPSSSMRTVRYHLHPRCESKDGALSFDQNTVCNDTNIRSGLIGSLFVNTGVPFLSGIREQLGMGIRTLFGKLPGGINRWKIAVYLSSPTTTTTTTGDGENGDNDTGGDNSTSASMKLRGRSKLNLRIKSSGTKAMIVAYLYDIDPSSGLCCLISHGCVSKHELIPD